MSIVWIQTRTPRSTLCNECSTHREELGHPCLCPVCYERVMGKLEAEWEASASPRTLSPLRKRENTARETTARSSPPSRAVAPLGTPAEGQRKLHSLLEAGANILVGFGVSVVANYFILPLYGSQPGWAPALEIGLYFTLISFIRSYLLRRGFNWLHTNTSWR